MVVSGEVVWGRLGEFLSQLSQFLLQYLGRLLKGSRSVIGLNVFID